MNDKEINNRLIKLNALSKDIKDNVYNTYTIINHESFCSQNDFYDQMHYLISNNLLIKDKMINGMLIHNELKQLCINGFNHGLFDDYMEIVDNYEYIDNEIINDQFDKLNNDVYHKIQYIERFYFS